MGFAATRLRFMGVYYTCEEGLNALKKKLVIFGTGDVAQLAHFYFTEDTAYDVVAFAVDGEYLSESVFCGLPVVTFEDVAEVYPPAQYDFFVALAYARQNAVRREKYLAVKALGFTCVSYISPRATVLNKGMIGDNCFILEDNVIQPFTVIGNNVVLWSGNHIGHHTIIRDHVFIASHVVVSGHVVIDEQCFLGVNATLRDNITIGSRCVIGAGALLLSDAEAGGLYKSIATPRVEIGSKPFVNI